MLPEDEIQCHARDKDESKDDEPQRNLWRRRRGTRRSRGNARRRVSASGRRGRTIPHFRRRYNGIDEERVSRNRGSATAEICLIGSERFVIRETAVARATVTHLR